MSAWRRAVDEDRPGFWALMTAQALSSGGIGLLGLIFHDRVWWLGLIFLTLGAAMAGFSGSLLAATLWRRRSRRLAHVTPPDVA